MAINFTISYTFSPSTTISSSQVNTNFSDEAAVWQGLEAKTKSFSNLKVDATPASATEVVIKSYVDPLMTWRRPVLQFGSTTTIAIESGLDGTSGDIPMLFPDGSYRVETSTTRTTFNITRNAVLVTSGAQSGLTGATAEANNTWYAMYAVKVTDSSTLWVTVGSTVFPSQANYATLNTAYGTSGWVYLGAVRNGDNTGGVPADILAFVMAGNTTMFTNTIAGASNNGTGMNLASSSSATTNTYTYAAGNTGTSIPANLTLAKYFCGGTPGAGQKMTVNNTSDARTYFVLQTGAGATNVVATFWAASTEGIKETLSNAGGCDIELTGFADGALGVGSNPLL